MTTGGDRLRLARQARGYSQQELAAMAGVTRQAVSAVESGLSDPSLRVALALARALGMTVEEVFGPGPPAPPVQARPIAPVGAEGSRVALAALGDGFVALPLAGRMVWRAGFLPADGIVADASDGVGRDTADGGGRRRKADKPRRVRPIGPPRPTVVVAGCDPALPLLEPPLGLLDPPVAFSWWPCGSREALALAAAGLVHVAGAHLRDDTGGYNTGAAAELLTEGADVVGFCSWREGLVLRASCAGGVASVGDAVHRGLRLVNREPGSEARRVLDRELAAAGIDPSGAIGYETRVTGHLEVAAAIAGGLADAGVASEPAALAYGLDFLPLAAERFDLVIPAGQLTAREVQGLLKVLNARWLLDQLANLPGYDASHCGEHLASVPPRPAARR